MRFEDAVRALKEGKCNGIKSKADATYRILEDIILVGVDNTTPCVAEILGEWELVEPLPQFEEVEIVKYLLIDKEGRQIVSDAKNSLIKSTNVVELKGTLKKEIKPKVKVLKQVGYHGVEGSFIEAGCPSGAKLYAYVEIEI